MRDLATTIISLLNNYSKHQKGRERRLRAIEIQRREVRGMLRGDEKGKS